MSYANPNFLAPRFIILVEGTKLKSDITSYISSLEYHEEEGASSKITLEVNNPRFRFCDSPVFAEGNSVDVWMGYGGHRMYFMNRGFIQRPNPEFPSGGMPVMKVVCHDLSRKLMQQKGKGKVYSKLRDSDIAKQIYQSLPNCGAFVFHTCGLKTRVRKREMTEWAFLEKLAKINGFEIYLRYNPEDTLHYGYFGPKDPNQINDYNFRYGEDKTSVLREFMPESNIADQKTEVTVVYNEWKTKRIMKVTVEVQPGDAAPKVKFVGVLRDRRYVAESIKNGPAIAISAKGQEVEVIADRTFRAPGDVKRFVAAWWKLREKDFLTGTGTLLGIPDVRIGQEHTITCPSRRFSGKWRLTAVTHCIRTGGQYEIKFKGSKKVSGSQVASSQDCDAVSMKQVSM